MRLKYGFLYKGYKPKAFFWECVMMFKKVGIAFISVFLNGAGTLVQALVALLFLVFFISLTSRHKPYLSRRLNQLEMASLLSLCVTFYCGLFYLSARDPSMDSFIPGKDCK